jgi:GTP cyclohydrolase I|tara:strand:+ start:135 stop:392 length:258 start_codon:yes stop_codon:yes gene_type:complete
MARAYGVTDLAKLKQVVNEGVQVSQEMDDLREGLRDTVKAVAEELDVKTSVLNKAIRVAHKAELQKTKDDMEELEDILIQVGRTA